MHIPGEKKKRVSGIRTGVPELEGEELSTTPLQPPNGKQKPCL